MAKDIIKNIPLTLDINARKRLNGTVDISLYSKDIATGQFEFTFVDEDGDPVVLDETYSAQALVKYEGSSKTYLNDMIIEGNIIRFIFPHDFITKDGTITMYIYITKDNYTSDVAAISFPVFVSEIDKDLDPSISVHYIGKIEQLIQDMKDEMSSYQVDVDEIIVGYEESISKLTNLETNYAPELENIAAQLAQTKNELNVKIDQKASINYVDAILMDIAKGGPKGLFNSLSTLISTYPNGADGTWLVMDSSFTDGAHSFLWDSTNSTWKDLGVYQSMGIADNTVTLEKMTFTPVFGDKSVNLFDKRKARLNKNMTSAGLVDNEGTYVSDFISVTPGSAMIFNHFIDPTSVYFYNNTGSEKDFLSFINISNTEGKLTVPTDATRLIFRSRMSNLETAQVQGGSLITEYEPFGGLLNTTYIKDKSIPLEKIDAIGKITPEYLPFVESREVPADKVVVKDAYTFVDNKIVNTTTGALEASDFYKTADKVPVSGYKYIFIYTGTSGADNATYFPLVLFKADGSVHTGYSQMLRAGVMFGDKKGWLIPIPDGVTTATISSSKSNHDNYTYTLSNTTDGILIPNLINVGKPVSKHQGKKAGFLGDSIVEEEPYFFAKIKEALGLTDLIDYGLGGSSYALRSSTTWDPVTITKRAKEMDSDLDIIFLLGGTNDFATASVLGTMSDRTEATFYGALHETLSGLIEKYPLASIYLLTMPPRRVRLEPNTQGEYISQYVNALKEVGAFYSVPVLDILSSSQMRPWNTTNNTYYYKGADGLHPNNRGYDVILNDMLPWVERS